MNASLVSLQKVVDPARILTQTEDLIPYSFDGTAALRQMPMAVVFPISVEEIAGIMTWARETRTPIVTRGSGTGLSGGSVPVEGCLILCLVKLDRVLELDRRNLTVLVEPGVITQTIADLADQNGLLYPPDPGSIKISTIGGNVAENSGGLRGFKYGVTRDYVIGLEVVLPSGETVWFGNKCVKDVAGYSMKDLFIGSEGTLGVITKILLQLIPKPPSRQTLLAVFDDMEAAARTVSEIIEKKIVPCTLEFLDRVTINSVEDYAGVGLPRDAEAVLLVETDGNEAAVREESTQMYAVAKDNGARSVRMAKNEAEGLQLATARRSAFAALARVAPTTILEDVTVPRSELARMVAFIQETARKHQLKIGVFGHMGDGNLHPTFLTNERDKAEMERVEQAMTEIFEFTIQLGGTITGEHGVGLAKKKFLARGVGEGSLQLMRQLKRTLDPLGLLNPGKIFDA